MNEEEFDLSDTYVICGGCGKRAFYNTEIGAHICECGLKYFGETLTDEEYKKECEKWNLEHPEGLNSITAL